MAQATHPVDEILPLGKLVPFGLQHVLVMAASPITSVFLVTRALHVPDAIAAGLVSATFLICGLGTLLQSFGPSAGPWRIGARLPFVMIPGGAPVAIFIAIARETNLQTAVGAVIITAIMYIPILAVFSRCLRYFPRLVIGTILLLVAINLIRIYGGIITGRPGTPGFGDPANILLALATVGFTVLFARLLHGTFRQLSVLLGLVAGTLLAAALGRMSLAGVDAGPIVSLPAIFPFGLPRFDLVASIPLVIFSAISMSEATGQTVAIAEVVGREIDLPRDVPATIRGDAIASFFGALLGTSLIITSGENIGIVRATGIKSRYVTAVAGIMLVVLALAAPVGRLVNAIPGPVIGGTALVVFCVIAVMGIDMLRSVDVGAHDNLFTLAVGLMFGLLPILVPGMYARFPRAVEIVLGNGLAAGTIATVLLNILFHHVRRRAPVAAVSPGAAAGE